jgi:hypothetical protein
VDDLGAYFIDRKAWFYSVLLAANGFDVLDSYLKGGVSNLLETPPVTYLIWVTIAVAGFIGLRARAARTHDVLGLVVLCLQILSGFSAVPSLSRLTS